MAEGVRPPKLSGLVVYYYSYCADPTSKVNEVVTIEVSDNAGVWTTAPISVVNGDFDSTKLNASLPYRVKIVETASITLTTTLPVYVQMILIVPPPTIDSLKVVSPI
ncbi:MAG: hypothetical protein IPK55_11515 [Streptococcus sp.]|nr:hypothetical protein [Streptococcus sp.]